MPGRSARKVFWKADAIALKTVGQLKSPGLFAVEMFANKNEQVYVNEIAPVFTTVATTALRFLFQPVHMLWRIMLSYPLEQYSQYHAIRPGKPGGPKVIPERLYVRS